LVIPKPDVFCWAESASLVADALGFLITPLRKTHTRRVHPSSKLTLSVARRGKRARAQRKMNAKPNGTMTRILGVDPASAGPTGYGVVETDGRSTRLVHFGIFKPARKDAPAARLREIHARLAGLVREYAPDAVAIESVFSALNVKTALKLAEVRGVVMLAAAQGNVPVHSYSPLEVKSSVTGYGHASKDQVQQMVRAELGLREAPQPADAADALAVALCHLHATRAQARFAAATGGAPVQRSAVNRRRASRIRIHR
jgi:crossover junction endodeoxyribonuclease RuvC